MRLRKILIRAILVLILVLIVAFIWLSFTVFPAVSGYGSKNLCSAVYLQHRKSGDIIREDLGFFPVTLGTFTVNEKDSSVTGSVWGLAKRKTIYRGERLGSTIINDYPEKEVRAQEFLLPAKPMINTDTLLWPIGDSVSIDATVNINKEKLENAVNSVMKETTSGESSAYTRAVLVVYDGKIVAEKYAPGFDKNTVLLGWSMSKSFTAALIGILVRENKLSVNSPAPVPEWTDTKKQAITLKQLLQQTTGIGFIEDYTKPSNVTKMLFSKGDMGAYAASLTLKHEPGTVFNYSGGNTNILSRIIRQIVGEKDYASFPYKELFYKINAYSFLLEPDASGTYIGSSYSYATARDFARFGLLYYYNGVWNNEQILPPNWVRETVQPSSADKQKHYGYQFWLNGFDENDSTKRLYPDAPPDMFFANGFGGQNIYIIPSKKLVVVRLGLQPINGNKFLKQVIESIHE